MVVDVQRHDVPVRVVSPVRLRAAVLPVWLVLSGIVGLSALLRMLASLWFQSPYLYPDEYIHAEIARSIAAAGRPLVRGGAAHFPALLEPILASPFWLAGDPHLAYRLTQGMQAVVVALAAVPAYLLCRRLGLGKPFSLGAAAVAVACPDLIYTSLLTGTAIAYPLVLGAVYMGVLVLDRPTRRSQLAFFVLAALATLARVQFVVLPAVLVVGMLVLERGRLVSLWRAWRLSLALYGGLAAVVLGLGARRALGYYSDVVGLHTPGGTMLHWVAVDSMLLAFAAGVVLVPGALAGISVSLVRSKDRSATAFAALFVVLAIAVFAEAALYAANGSARFQERYLFTLFPLLAPAFGVWLKRGRPARPLALAVAGVLLTLTALVPLSGYFQRSGKQDSPLLLAADALSGWIGLGSAALAVALLLGGLSLLAVFLTFAGRRGASVALAVTLAFGVVGSVGAAHREAQRTVEVRTQYFPAGDTRWVDHAGVGPVAWLQLLQEPGPVPIAHLFWNTSVNDVLLLGGAAGFDAFSTQAVRVAPDGRLLIGGRPVRESLLVSTLEGLARFEGAERVGGNAVVDLWRATGIPRLSLLARPRYLDSWLGVRGTITVWPGRSGDVRGTLTLALTLPRWATANRVRLSWPGGRRAVLVSPGGRRVVRIAAAAHGPWVLQFAAPTKLMLGVGRPVGVQAPVVDFAPAAAR